MKLIITSFAIFCSVCLSAQSTRYKLDTNEIDFGESPCGEVITKTIKITNLTDANTTAFNLIGGNFRTSAGWCIVVLPEKIIESGNSSTIEIKCMVRKKDGSYTATIGTDYSSSIIKIKGISICGH